MLPSAGTTCLFTFTSRFSTLNGVYRIRAETTFTDAVASGVNFVDNLYTPAGLDTTNFNADYSSYEKDRVAVLESVVDNSVVYYTPESIFLNVPDPTINEYYSLIVVANLGVFKNTQDIFPLLDSMKDLIQAQLGVTDPLRVVTNPQNKIYLTDAQYQTIANARQTNAQALSPLSVQLHQEQLRNAYLTGLVASYEALIAMLA